MIQLQHLGKLLGLVILFFQFNWAFAVPSADSSITNNWDRFAALAIREGNHNFGLAKVDQWRTILLANTSDTVTIFYLRFHNPHINQLNVYKNHDTVPLLTTGDWYSFSKRPVLFRDFVIPLRVNPHKTDSFLLRFNKRGESLSIHFEVLSSTELLQVIVEDYWWLGIVTSFVLLVSLVAFFIGFNFQDKLYYLFSCYSILALAWLLNNTGLLFQYCWPNDVLWHYKSRTVFSFASITAYLLFLFYYFKNRLSRLDRVIFSVFILFLLLKLIGVLIAPTVEFKLNRKYLFILLAGVGLLAFLIYLLFFFIRYFRKSGMDRFHLAAFMVYSLLILQETLIQFGYSIFSFASKSDFVPTLFFFLQLLLMGIGLSIRIKSRLQDTRLQELFNVRSNERAISNQYAQMQESERSRIGRDIHDQLGGLLVSIKLNLSNLKLRFFDHSLHHELDRVRIIVDSSINQLHQVVHDLVPPTVTTDNFRELIAERIRLFEETSDIHFEFNAAFDAAVPKSVLVHLYRIICELISNSVQHAHCTKVSIRCQFQNSRLVLAYTDNGLGFSPAVTAYGHGLNNIKQRVSLLKGVFNLSTSDSGIICQIEADLTQYHEANTLSL